MLLTVGASHSEYLCPPVSLNIWTLMRVTLIYENYIE